MRILTLTLILGLPLMALGQREEPQQSPAQSNETQTTEPAKGKQKAQTKSETDTNVRGQTNVQGRAEDMLNIVSGSTKLAKRGYDIVKS